MSKKSANYMKAHKFGISIVVIFLVASSSCTNLGNITPVGKLLIDVDAGSDDALALIMATEADKFNDGPKIIGITCVNGNIDVDQVALNVLKTLKVVERLDIPVYKGAAHPLLLENRRDYYFGKDGYGDFYYPDPPSLDLIQSKHAANAMIDLVKAHPGEVTLLALGPLTNVALAIRMYPPFLDELQQLIIMGGCIEGYGNARPGLEFNFVTDPVANYIVFNASTSKPVIWIPYETTLKAIVDMSVRLSFKNLNSTKGWLIDSMEGDLWNPDAEHWDCVDTAAASVALTSGSIVTKSGIYYSEAIYEGSRTSGMIVVDYTNITGNPANTNIILGIDTEIYKRLLLKYLT